jgi:hypothetical protein
MCGQYAAKERWSCLSEPDVEERMGRNHVVSQPKLNAYRLSQWPPMHLVTAHSSRDCMDATPNRFANRRLPLRIANQAASCAVENMA